MSNKEITYCLQENCSLKVFCRRYYEPKEGDGAHWFMSIEKCGEDCSMYWPKEKRNPI